MVSSLAEVFLPFSHFLLTSVDCVDCVNQLRGIGEVHFVETLLEGFYFPEGTFLLREEFVCEFSEQIFVQRVVQIIDLQLHVFVVHHYRAEALLEGSVVESISTQFDVCEHSLPGAQVVTELVMEKLCIQVPKCLVRKPCLYVLFGLVDGVIDSSIGCRELSC